MNKICQPVPCRLVLGRVEAGATGGDAPLRADTGHLGIDQPRPALGPLGIMGEMPIGGAAVLRLVLRHRRDDDAVGKLHLAQSERREHRRARGIRPRLLLEPCFRLAEPARIA